MKVDEVALARHQARADVARRRRPCSSGSTTWSRSSPSPRARSSRRKIGTVKAVTDVSLAIRQGETFGLVGESGCGKTTMGRHGRRPRAPDVGRGRLRGRGHHRRSTAGALRRRRRDLQMMFQDPYASLDPRMRVGSILREPLKVQSIGSRDEQQARVLEMLERGRPPATRRRALPPRVLRRPAPAHRPGPGPRARAEVDRRRRAGLGARRLDPGADPQPAEGPAGAPRPDLPLHLARPRGGQVHGRPHRRHVPRQARRVGPGPRPLRPAGAPLHQGADRHDPRRRPDVPVSSAGGHITGELPSSVDPPSGCRFRTRCPFAQERCADEEPAAASFGDGHVAACHFPLQTPTGRRRSTQLGSTSADRRPEAMNAGLRAQRCWSRTSRASRSASPMKLKATTTSTMQRPAG